MKLFEAKDAQECLIIDSSTPVTELKKDNILAALLVQYETRSGDAANKDRKNLVAAWNWGVKESWPKGPGFGPPLEGVCTALLPEEARSNP